MQNCDISLFRFTGKSFLQSLEAIGRLKSHAFLREHREFRDLYDSIQIPIN